MGFPNKLASPKGLYISITFLHVTSQTGLKTVGIAQMDNIQYIKYVLELVNQEFNGNLQKFLSVSSFFYGDTQ